MTKYILRRLLIVVPTVLGVIFIIFTIMSLTPSSPGRLMLGPNASLEQVEMLNDQLGYNKPFFTRFFDYILGILQGDFGNSYRSRQPVLPDLALRLPYTMRIGVTAMLCSAALGISLGILSAVKQYTVADTLSTALAILMASVPAFWLGMMLMLLFSVKLNLLPSVGIETWKHYIMPIATIALTTSAGLLRLTRTTMLETIRQDYIRTARAKGCPEGTVIWKHALKNACLPLITNLGLRFGYVLGGTVIIENVFGIPGVGNYILMSINNKDIPAVMSSTLVIAGFFCVVMVLVDIVYSIVDPRIRERFSS